jgi:hypothetical protein
MYLYLPDSTWTLSSFVRIGSSRYMYPDYMYHTCRVRYLPERAPLRHFERDRV